MAVITDPSDLSQGASTAVNDMVFGTPTGNAVTLTSSGGNLPALSDGMFFAVRGHSEAVNNGLYYVNDASPSTSEVDVEKVTGSNPVAASSESCTTLGNTNTELSIYYDTAARKIYCPEQGNLDADGLNGQAAYSRAVNDWKDDDYLIFFPFPMLCIDSDAGKFILGQDPSGNYNGWDWADNATYSIRTTKLLRNCGWASYDASGNLLQVWPCIETLGTFEDSANDTAYFQFGTNKQTNDSVDFDFAGPVNQSLLAYDATVTRAVATPNGYDFTDGGGSDDSIDRNDGGSFITDGYKVGGYVVVENATTGANDGTLGPITSVSASSLGLPTGTVTADTDDNTATLAVDNRAAFTVRLRVRDADTYGKSFGQSNLAAIGKTALSNFKFSFPLGNAEDRKIEATDATIAGSAPYTGMSVTFYATPQSLGGGGVLVGGPYNFGIVIDANSGTNQQVFEFVQYLLRQTSDIDSGAGTVIGRCMDGLCQFFGDSFEVGSTDKGATFPTNPFGGGSGVFVSNLSAASQNSTTVYDNTGTQRSFPEAIAGTIDLNQTLIDDTEAEYVLLFDRTLRNTVSDLVITAGSGASGTFDSSGANLPATLNRGAGAYVRVSGLTGGDAAMNGVYQVTALTSTSQWNVTRYDGTTIATTSSASLNVDENCIDTPDAIVVDDATSTDISGMATADIPFSIDFSGNTQGGRSGATNMYVVGRAIGRATAQHTQSGVITISSGSSPVVPLSSNVERNVAA